MAPNVGFLFFGTKPKAQKLCIDDVIVDAYETPTAKKHRLHNEMVAVSEKSEACGTSVGKAQNLVVEVFVQMCVEPYKLLFHDWQCDQHHLFW